jgi:hypothetical protein
MAHEQKYPVYFPLGDMLSLKFHLRDTRPGVDPDTFVVELVQNWLTVNTERSTLRQDGPPLRGFQWKKVFLPEGTNLRTSYRHSVEFAKVMQRARREFEMSLKMKSRMEILDCFRLLHLKKRSN